MLVLRDIHKSFGDVRVLNGIDLRLEKGTVSTLKGGKRLKKIEKGVSGLLHRCIRLIFQSSGGIRGEYRLP